MSLRIAHLSDIHFGGEDKEAVEAAVSELAALAPDLIVVTGDVTLNGLPEEFIAARDWLRRLPTPLLVTPGNHDTPYWNLILRTATPFDRYRRYIGPPKWSAFDGPRVCARAINSARGAQARLDWSKGAIDRGQLGRLGWEAAAPLKLLACHHPLIDPPGAPVGGRTRGGPAAARMLTAQHVELVLTGHIHVPFAMPLPGSTRPCYGLGAGTLSVRTRGTPPSFSTIDVESGAFEVVVRGWVDGAFRPIETLRLPRQTAGGEAVR